MWWLISVYLLQTWAELLLSPTGLSASTTLAPIGMGSQVLALWFLAVSVGDAIGGQLVQVSLELATATSLPDLERWRLLWGSPIYLQ